MLLLVNGRLENDGLPINTKHQIINPGRYPLSPSVVLSEYRNSGHAGPAYTRIKTCQCFWIIDAVGNVKCYRNNCGKSALLKAKPVRQPKSDLPEGRLTVSNKPFWFSGLDYSLLHSF